LTLYIHCCSGEPDDIVSIDLIDFEPKEQPPSLARQVLDFVKVERIANLRSFAWRVPAMQEQPLSSRRNPVRISGIHPTGAMRTPTVKVGYGGIFIHTPHRQPSAAWR